ncbi:hypothetical protein NBRC116495_28860 [Aurantivibrio plasticivorans]
MDTYFPNLVEVINGNDVDIDVAKLVGSPEIETMFVIPGEKLAPQEKFTTQVQDETAEALRNMAFTVAAKCKHGDDWRKPAPEVVAISTETEPYSKVVITLNGCN